MSKLKAANVAEIHLECPAGATSILLELFNITGDQTYWQLLENNYEMLWPDVTLALKQLAIAAFEHHIKLIPVDEPPSELQSREVDDAKLPMRNKIIAKHSVDRLQNLEKDKMVIGLFGSAHYEILQLIQGMSDDTISSESYFIMAEQLCQPDLSYLQNKLQILSEIKNYNHSAIIPNLINQKESLLSLQRALRCRDYFKYAFAGIKKCCFFPCSFISKNLPQSSTFKEQQDHESTKINKMV